MEFECDVSRVLGADAVSVWDATSIRNVRNQQSKALLQRIIDSLGKASQEAQGLSQPITSVSRLETFPDQVLYVWQEDGLAVGIIKVGYKNLFIRTDIGTYKELRPLCVLDFYVHESRQRQGVGKRLFEFMLEHQGVRPHRLAYDRPSPKLLGFLGKHYNLKNYTPQANNFVVFKRYFSEGSPKTRADQSMVSVSTRPISPHGRDHQPSFDWTGEDEESSPATPSTSASVVRAPPAPSGNKENESGAPKGRGDRMNGSSAYLKYSPASPTATSPTSASTAARAPPRAEVNSMPASSSSTTTTTTSSSSSSSSAMAAQASEAAARYREKRQQQDYSQGIEQAMRAQVARSGSLGQRSSPMNPLSNAVASAAPGRLSQQQAQQQQRLPPRPSDYEPVLSGEQRQPQQQGYRGPQFYAVPPRR